MAIDFQVKTIERFWSFVDRQSDDRCWPWLGATDKDGYGVFGLSTKIKTVRASRFAWTLEHGDPGKLLVLHTCDNPPCVNNVRHLLLGTPKQNSEDMVKKGRCHPGLKGRPELAVRGEDHGLTTLTEEMVSEIRRRYRPRVVTLHQLGAEYGVSYSTIFNVVNGKTWGHVQ